MICSTESDSSEDNKLYPDRKNFPSKQPPSESKNFPSKHPPSEKKNEPVSVAAKNIVKMMDISTMIRDAAIFQNKSFDSPEGLPATHLSIDETTKSQLFALGSDICRICHLEGTPEKPVYHPCICTGSIKFVHQDCLLQWLEFSKNDYCEICNHLFSFTPIYSPDMPKRLPIKDVFIPLLRRLCTVVRFLLHYALVATLWSKIVPLTASRTYEYLINGTLNLNFDIRFTEALYHDTLQGYYVMLVTWLAFFSLMCLTGITLDAAGPEWLEAEHNMIDQPENNNVQGINVALANVNWIQVIDAAQLSCDQMLGLDGSFGFLKYASGVVFLSILFIVLFAFLPYRIGQFAISSFGFKDYTVELEVEGFLTTLFGYISIGIILILLHKAAVLIRLNRPTRILGICCVVIKLSLISVIEFAIFPLVCGWFLDICSLTMLNVTVHDRKDGFKLAPGMCMFFHWLFGTLYLLCVSSFILLLREVVRPNLLWCVIYVDDPNFNPFQQMLRSPILKRIRRELFSFAIFQGTILLVVWFPIRIIEKIAHGFLPYHLKLFSEMSYSELSELVLLLVILSAHFLHGHMRECLKCSVRTWYIGVSYILDIQPNNVGDVNVNKQIFLIFFFCISLTLGSLVMITVPVFVGRKLLTLCLENVDEFYTLGCGLSVMLCICTLLWSWIPQGWTMILEKLKEWFAISFKMLCAMSILLGPIPILMGLHLGIPFLVSLNMSSTNVGVMLNLRKVWIVGILLTISFCVTVLIGPNWRTKILIEQVYAGGIRNINLHLIRDLALLLTMILGLSLSIPYIIAKNIIPIFSSSYELQNIFLIYIYKALLVCVLTLHNVVSVILYAVHQFSYFLDDIKDDKYLIGERLENYEH